MRKDNGAFIKKIIFSVIILLIFIYAFRFYASPAPEKNAAPHASQTHGRSESAVKQNDVTDKIPSATAHQASTGEVSVASPAGVQAAPADRTAEKKERPEQAGARQAAKPVETSAKKGVITGNGVNVRSESRVDANNSNVVVKVNKGEKVDIIGAEKPANDNRQWYNVKLKNGKTGFVREDLIKIE